MAFRLALNLPHVFAGAVSLGGPFPTGFNPLAQLTAARGLRWLLSTGRESRRYPPEQVCENLRLLYAAGMSISLRQYPCGDDLTTQMLGDVDRWIMEQLATPQTSRPAARRLRPAAAATDSRPAVLDRLFPRPPAVAAPGARRALWPSPFPPGTTPWQRRWHWRRTDAGLHASCRGQCRGDEPSVDSVGRFTVQTAAFLWANAPRGRPARHFRRATRWKRKSRRNWPTAKNGAKPSAAGARRSWLSDPRMF